MLFPLLQYSISRVAFHSSRPCETAFDPSPNQSFDQQKKENQNRDKGPDRQPGERHRERHQKHCFHIKDQKDDAVGIILRSKLHLRIADRFDAAFVGRVFRDAWFRRLKEMAPDPSQAQRHHRKDQRHRDKDNNEQIRVRGHYESERNVMEKWGLSNRDEANVEAVVSTACLLNWRLTQTP